MSLRDSVRAVAGLLQLVSRARIARVLSVAAALTVTESLGLLLLLPLLQEIGVGGNAPSAGASVASTLFAAAGIEPTLTMVLTLYVAVTFAQSGLNRTQSTLMTSVEQDTVYDLRRRVYAALARARWEFFARQRSSDFTHVLTHEVDRVGNAAYYAVDFTVTLGTLAAYGALALRLSPHMTAIVATVGLGLAVALRGRLERGRSSGEQISIVTRRLYAALADHLAGMKTTKSFGAEARHIEILDALAGDVRRVQRCTADEYGRFRQLLSCGAAAALAAIIYSAVAWLRIETAALLVLLFIFARLVPRLTGAYEKAQMLVAELPALAAVLDLEQRCLAAAPEPRHAATGIRFEKRVSLTGVSVQYHGREASPALRQVDLDVPAGSIVAIVGPSGAGKSTVADLLLGLIVPTAGTVSVDGRVLDEGALDGWRRQIGYVPQDPVLFHDTIRANLLWAQPTATERDIRDALRLAAADEFVFSLPLGLETIVGDRGVQLSGGQRQRIALARALIRTPALLVLDEATSALDTENERLIERALRGLRGSMTIVIVSHRAAFVQDADVVYALDGGRVVQAGPRRARAALVARSSCDVVNHVA